MKRGSVVGPLVLILIGLAFLLRNFRPDIELFRTFLYYWPFLLIAWGLLRFIEVTLWRVRGRGLPCAGISGGEWVLIAFITVFGLSAWGVEHISSGWTPGRFRIGGMDVFGESFDYSLEGTRKCGKTPRIFVYNPRGSTRIVGADADEIKLTGRKVIRALDRSEADRDHGRSPFEITQTGDKVEIRTNLDRLDHDRRASADLEIAVPRGATVECRGRSADFDISDINGAVTLDSDRAGVRLQKIGGNVRIDLRGSDIVRAMDVKGDLELKGRGRDIELENVAGQVTIAGSYSGETTLRKIAKPVHFESSSTDLRLEKLPGDLRMTLGNLSIGEAAGPLRLKARSKDVQLTDVANGIELDVERGDIEIRYSRSAVAKTEVRVNSGNVELAVPQNARYTLSGGTERGEVTAEGGHFKITEEGRGAKVVGSAGQGGPELKLNTGHGALVVRRIAPGETAPLAPPAPVPPAPPKPPRGKELPRADNQ